MSKRWELNQSVFGPLWKYVKDESITDIDWDGGEALWLKNTSGQVWKAKEQLTPDFVTNFSQFVANHESQAFNQVENTLSAETETLRITFAHESLVTSGCCFSIRKSMPMLRFSATEAIEANYCDELVMHFLVNAVIAHRNIAFCGEPGHGKTECAKFFSSFIPSEEKVITVEDTLEWHYGAINQGKRFNEIKVNSNTDYTKSIKLALRLNPTWLMLSEARSKEVCYLLEGWSSGVHGMTTLHTNDVRQIPDRIANMIGDSRDEQQRINNVYSFLDLGVLLVEEKTSGQGMQRKIKQVGAFVRKNGENHFYMLWEDGMQGKWEIPHEIIQVFVQNGIRNPLYSKELEERLAMEKEGIFYGMSKDKETRGEIH